MERFRICIIGLFLLLLPISVGANPLPYVEKQENATAHTVFEAIMNLPPEATARTEFFKLIKANHGLDEEILTVFFKTGKFQTRTCKDCSLLTAGLQDGKSHYWRTVNNGEQVVYLYFEGHWRPLFLLPCGNPVRPEETVVPHLDLEKITVEKDEVVITTSVKSCYCCWQTGPTQSYNRSVFTSYVHEGFLTGNTRVYETRSSGNYFPIRCITDKDWQEIKKEGGIQ